MLFAARRIAIPLIPFGIWRPPETFRICQTTYVRRGLSPPQTVAKAEGSSPVEKVKLRWILELAVSGDPQLKMRIHVISPANCFLICSVRETSWGGTGALFCTLQKLNPLVFMSLRALSQKHPGGGYPGISGAPEPD